MKEAEENCQGNRCCESPETERECLRIAVQSIKQYPIHTHTSSLLHAVSHEDANEVRTEANPRHLVRLSLIVVQILRSSRKMFLRGDLRIGSISRQGQLELVVDSECDGDVHEEEDSRDNSASNLRDDEGNQHQRGDGVELEVECQIPGRLVALEADGQGFLPGARRGRSC